MKAPITTSELVDTPNRRVMDLTKDGIKEVPILGMNRSIRTTEGSFFHRHRGMEITYCAQGSVKFDCGGRAYSIIPGNVFISAPSEVGGCYERLFWILDAEKPKSAARRLKLQAAVLQLLVALAEAGKSAADGDVIRTKFIKMNIISLLHLISNQKI